MTIETITDLKHEYMYDRLNDPMNSNDGRNIKHVQERPRKGKWSEKATYDKNKNDRSTKNQDTKITGADNAEHLTGPENTNAQPNR